MTTDVIINPDTGRIYWNSGANDQSISIGGNASDQIFITGYNSYYSPNSNPNPSGTDWVIFNDSATGTLVPGSSGNDLGSSSNRWELFATNGNYSGTIRINDTTNSVSRISGSLHTAGGIGVSLNASIGGTLFFTGLGNTNLLGIRAGALIGATFTYTLPVMQPSGTGLSILTCDSSGNMSWINNTVLSGNINEIPYYFINPSGVYLQGSSNFKNETANNKISIGYSTETSSTTSGSLILSGGLGVSKSVSIGQTFLLFNNNANGFYTGLRSSQVGISTIYTLPPSTPSSSAPLSSILQSNNIGGLSWTSFYPNITKSVTIISPQDTDKVTLFFVDHPITINKIQTVVRGVSGAGVSWQVYHGLRDQSTTALFGSTQASGNNSTGNTHNSGFNDNTVEANKFVWVELSSVALGTSEFHMTVFYPHG